MGRRGGGRAGAKARREPRPPREEPRPSREHRSFQRRLKRESGVCRPPCRRCNDPSPRPRTRFACVAGGSGRFRGGTRVRGRRRMYSEPQFEVGASRDHPNLPLVGGLIVVSQPAPLRFSKAPAHVCLKNSTSHRSPSAALTCCSSTNAGEPEEYSLGSSETQWVFAGWANAVFTCFCRNARLTSRRIGRRRRRWRAAGSSRGRRWCR